MRPHRLLPLVVLTLVLPATAHATTGCKANPAGSFCTQHVRSHHSETVGLGSACHARRIYAIDASRNADASADAHFVAPHTIRMLNDIWSNHETFGPLDVYGYYLSGHKIRFSNHSRFAVNVYFTKLC